MALPTLDSGNEDKKKNETSNQTSSLPSFEMPPIGNAREPDGFETLPVNEALYNDNDDENFEIYEEEQDERKPLPAVEENEKNFIKTENDYNPDYEADLEKEGKEEFIDKKSKKIIPFGGKKTKSKSVVKSSDFDERKNKLAKTKVIQFFILAVIFILFLVGLKNTFFPAHVYTDTQIMQFAAQGAGKTGFPEERGAAFVESFADFYLTIDKEREDLEQMMSYFYGGAKGTNTKIQSSNTVKQKIIIEPRVFEVKLLSDYSAQYKVSAYVSDTTGKEYNEGTATGRWLSFAINVYYDRNSNHLTITEDSPSVIPSYPIGKQMNVPTVLPLGNGEVNREMEPVLSPTINGFVEAYAKASYSSHESIIQYIDDKKNVELISGFGGSVVLDGAPSEAIKKTIYNSNDGSYRVDVTVNWLDNLAKKDGNNVEYSARYMMSIVQIGEGKYAVSSFKPFTYYKK